VNRFERLIASWQAGQAELAPIATLLGIRPVSHGDGEAVVEMEVGARFHNAMGTLHGGVLLDLADVAMGVAFATVLEEGESFTTLQSSVSYLAAVREEKLTAAARVVQRGRDFGHLECEVLGNDGRTVARTTSVCAIRIQ
jgi:uncharacterized protein (TIGR00369 family)